MGLAEELDRDGCALTWGSPLNAGYLCPRGMKC